VTTPFRHPGTQDWQSLEHPNAARNTVVNAVSAARFMSSPRIPWARAPRPLRQVCPAHEILAAYVDRELLGGDASAVDLPKRLVVAHPSRATAWLLLSHAREARHETDDAHDAWEEMLRPGGAPDAPVVLELRVARPD
jgi:hypothetical protein